MDKNSYFEEENLGLACFFWRSITGCPAFSFLPLLSIIHEDATRLAKYNKADNAKMKVYWDLFRFDHSSYN